MWISKKVYDRAVADKETLYSDLLTQNRERSNERKRFEELMRALEVILPESLAPVRDYYTNRGPEWDCSNILAAADAVTDADNKMENDALVELVNRMKGSTSVD